MPLPTPGFFKTDRLPKWRAAVLGGWLWLRLRFRHNPGFATAAVAGSIGLVLAVILLLNGGYQTWMASRTAPAEELDNAEHVANLGEAGSLSKEQDETEIDDLLNEQIPNRKKSAPPQDEPPFDDDDSASFVKNTANVREKAPSKRFDDPVASESQDELEETEMEAVPERKSPALALTPAKKEEDDESDHDGGGFLPNDKPTLTQSPGKASISLPADVEDETPADEEPAEKLDLQPLPVKKNTRPAIAEDDPLVAREEDEADDTADTASSTGTGTTIVKSKEPETSVEEDLEPVTKPVAKDEPPLETRPRSGWKYSTTKPNSGKAAPPLPIAEQESSEEVQTTIHAVPVEPEVKPQIERASVNPEPAKPQAASSPLRLEVKAPAQVAPGQSFDLEFVVTNMGDASAKGAMLSVALPAGLNHPMGPELERPVPQLGPWQAYRVRLTVKAVSAGTARPQADVSFGGRPATKSAPAIEVRKQIGPQAKVPSDCYCAPLRPLY